MSKILIVDDDATFVRLLNEDLANYNQFEVLSAMKKGDEFLILKKEAVDLVVVNLDAGNIDGCEFLSLMSSSYPNIPCIVLAKNYQAPDSSIDDCHFKDSIFAHMNKPGDMTVIGGAILEGLYRIDENDFAPGICAARLLSVLESERKTARLQVKFGSKKQGAFDVVNGILINAWCDGKEGEEAAREIISWPPVGFKLETLSEVSRHPRISPDFLKVIPQILKAKSCELPGSLDQAEEVPEFKKKIKLFIVDDSRMMRNIIAKVFEDDEFVEVVGQAANGEEALQIMPQLKPDVVTLDVQMPVMDGITTLKHMMIQAPTPTVMLSAYTREGAEVTFDALKYGAVDFVAKPSRNAGLDLSEQSKEIVKKIYLAAGVDQEALKYIRAVANGGATEGEDHDPCEKIVAIGAAEGGYGTLIKIIPHLSLDKTTSCLISLYVSPDHADSFVDYLQKYSKIKVRRARTDIPLQGGICYLASGEEYFTVHEGDEGLDLHLSPAPFAGRRGSINMLMFSVAEITKEKSLGIILTGMGNDGVEGLAEIHRVGGSAFVQNPDGCLYREMPDAVLAEFKNVVKIVSDAGMAVAVQEFVTSK